MQKDLNEVQNWTKKWRIKPNETKSVHVTFITSGETCPPVNLNDHPIPQAEDDKYLGVYLDRRLTWKKHIFTKRKQLGRQLSKMYWILGRRFELSLGNKILIYKSILKPVWTYGIQLWGTAANSNLEILQRFQPKMLRIIVDVPWFVTNESLHRDLKMPTIKEEIKNLAIRYRDRLEIHPNAYSVGLMKEDGSVRRLKRKILQDLVK